MQKRLSTAATAAISVSGLLRPPQQLGTTAASSATTRTCWLRTEQQALRADAVSALQQLRIYCGQLLDASADLQLSGTLFTRPKPPTFLCTSWNLISSCFLLFGRFCQVAPSIVLSFLCSPVPSVLFSSAEPLSNPKSCSTPKLAGGHLFPTLYHLFYHCEHLNTTLTLNKTSLTANPNGEIHHRCHSTFGTSARKHIPTATNGKSQPQHNTHRQHSRGNPTKNEGTGTQVPWNRWIRQIPVGKSFQTHQHIAKEDRGISTERSTANRCPNQTSTIATSNLRWSRLGSCSERV